MYVFSTFAKNQVAVALWVYFLALHFISLVYVCVFVPVPHCFCYYGSVV
jgi:hypothetical protein